MLNFVLLLLIYMGLYTILALGQNLITGYTGLLSLCQAAFFGIGAYTTAILLTTTGLSFWIVLGISALIAGFFGFLIGLPTLRLKGDYLAIATLGFGEIVRNIILNWDSLTRGPMGINSIRQPKIFGWQIPLINNKPVYLLIIWIFVGIIYFLFKNLIKSRFGRALESIREDEVAADSMGIHVTKYKIVSFVLGSFIAGLSGSLWSVYNQSVTPETFTFMLSVMILCMVVLGGLGNNLATILGALIIVLASELPRLLGLSQFFPAEANQIIFGLILVVMMVKRPQGIFGRKKVNFELEVKNILAKTES